MLRMLLTTWKPAAGRALPQGCTFWTRCQGMKRARPNHMRTRRNAFLRVELVSGAFRMRQGVQLHTPIGPNVPDR